MSNYCASIYGCATYLQSNIQLPNATTKESIVFHYDMSIHSSDYWKTDRNNRHSNMSLV